jgi:hypothetical protein
MKKKPMTLEERAEYMLTQLKESLKYDPKLHKQALEMMKKK